MGYPFRRLSDRLALGVQISDEEVRRAAARAINKMKVDTFAGYTDRLLPVASIPMHTPEEAIDELPVRRRYAQAARHHDGDYVRRPNSRRDAHLARSRPLLLLDGYFRARLRV